MGWNYLFDSEYKQRDDIDALKKSADFNSEALDDSIRLTQKAQQRIAKLELTIEALIRLLETRGGLDRQELALMIQQVDLADGSEDGRIGPDRTASAPRCAECARPVNPNRDACIYCNAKIAREAPPPPPPIMTTCRKCTKDVAEVKAFITMHGLMCPVCYASYEG